MNKNNMILYKGRGIDRSRYSDSIRDSYSDDRLEEDNIRDGIY